jgi:peptidoglycan-N-acetylglucosamine deacetylase
MILLALLFAFDVAVTVDDLPAHGPAQDPVQVAHQVISALRKHQISAYGFVNGRTLAQRPELKAVLDAWHAAGFSLGNHGFSHLDPNKTPLADYLADIQRNEPLLAQYGAEKVFRYPFLFEGDTPDRRTQTAAWLKQHGYRKADVSLDFDDWAWNPPWARCLRNRDEIALGELRHTYLDAAVRILARTRALSHALFGRDIAYVLLLHIGEADADQLDAMLSSYEAAGARWVTLDQAQKDPAYAQDPGFVTPWGFTLLDRLAKARKLKLPGGFWPDEKRLEEICQ